MVPLIFVQQLAGRCGFPLESAVVTARKEHSAYSVCASRGNLAKKAQEFGDLRSEITFNHVAQQAQWMRNGTFARRKR